jgi:trans-AT polyketide synthase, acyltransferase and oxidoreductase domains
VNRIMSDPVATALGWCAGETHPAFTSPALTDVVRRFREPVHVLSGPNGERGLGVDGSLGVGGYPVLGMLPPIYPEWLGDRSFTEAHGVRFPYVAGEMANGIATVDLVIAMARAEMLAFFGAAGLGPDRIEAAVAHLSQTLTGRSNWGVNLISSLGEPDLEDRVADILLERRVPRISASAYIELSPAVVRCAVAGLRRDAGGRVIRPRALFAKLSRPEVATKFLSPAPPPLLRVLIERGQISVEEAALAATVPVATDVTVEADSGGHTDNRPLAVLLPVMFALRDELAHKFGYSEAPRIGAAGGLGCPAAVAAAFALGAAYVLIGSVNQTAVEAGVSADAKAMLAQADLADVAMAPAADMFEMGVRVQVLRRGTLFAVRAARLYDAYRSYPSLEAMPESARETLEREVLGASIEQVWAWTQDFWRQRGPAELDRADGDPKHRMALVFRWYLGMSSQWAVEGRIERRTDYQLWAGPALGAFNRWVSGSFLADPAARSVVQIARNLLEGAAAVTRAYQIRVLGVPVPPDAFTFTPRPLA